MRNILHVIALLLNGSLAAVHARVGLIIHKFQLLVDVVPFPFMPFLVGIGNASIPVYSRAVLMVVIVLFECTQFLSKLLSLVLPL